MGQLTPPATVAQFKAQFVRDFPYGAAKDTVMDADIQAGLNMASNMFNPDLFDTTPVGLAPNQTSEALQAYLFAAAHFMVLSLQAAGGLGIYNKGAGASNQGEGIIASKSVGGISASYSWPEWVVNSPALFGLTKTHYGQQYLQVLMLKLVGNTAIVAGPNDVTDAAQRPDV